MSAISVPRLPAFLSALALAALLCACAPRNLTPEQRVTERDQQECGMLANNMSDPPYSSINALWNGIFEECMQERGYTPEQLQTLRY